MNIVWIDDDDTRRGESKNLAHRLDSNVLFISSKNNEGGTEMEDAIKQLKKEPPPDVVLMDHTLTNSNSDTLRSGPSVIFMLKEVWESTPFIAVSGSTNEITPFEQRVYQALIPFDQLKSYDSLLKSIVSGVSIVNSKKLTSISELFELMKVPEIDRERLENIKPVAIDKEWGKPDLALEVYRWLSITLFDRPGFLYDKLWASTHLGLSVSGFEKVEEIFQDAKYNGIFSNDDSPLWWKSTLVKILMEQAQEFGLPWEIGRKLNGIAEEDYSKDEISPDDIPEIVAYEDSVSTDRYATCLKNTVPHPNYDNKLYFEEIRMIKAQ